MLKICPTCKKEYKTYYNRQKNCSIKCKNIYMGSISPNGRFKKGHKSLFAWKKGSHISPSTEFRKGNRPINYEPIGTIHSRTVNKKQHCNNKFIKIAEPNIWESLSIHIWKKYNGKIPKGMIIHFKDLDNTNYKINNLQLITRAKHINIHRDLINAFKL